MYESIWNVKAALWNSFLIFFCPLSLGFLASMICLGTETASYDLAWLPCPNMHNTQGHGFQITSMWFLWMLSYLYLSFLSYIGRHCFTAVKPLLEGPSYKACPQEVLSEAASMFLIILLHFPHSPLSKGIVSLSPDCEYWDYFSTNCI